MLEDTSRRLYARQLMLPEIGEQGQLRLGAARLRMTSGDAGARAVAREYLLRAGVGSLDTPGDSDVSVADSAAVHQLAGGAVLYEAAAWLAGSLAAVETIKRVVHAGQPARLDAAFVLTSEAL